MEEIEIELLELNMPEFKEGIGIEADTILARLKLSGQAATIKNIAEDITAENLINFKFTASMLGQNEIKLEMSGTTKDITEKLLQIDNSYDLIVDKNILDKIDTVYIELLRKLFAMESRISIIRHQASDLVDRLKDKKVLAHLSTGAAE